jgi:hypothetical protein
LANGCGEKELEDPDAVVQLRQQILQMLVVQHKRDIAQQQIAAPEEEVGDDDEQQDPDTLAPPSQPAPPPPSGPAPPPPPPPPLASSSNVATTMAESDEPSRSVDADLASQIKSFHFAPADSRPRREIASMPAPEQLSDDLTSILKNSLFNLRGRVALGMSRTDSVTGWSSDSDDGGNNGDDSDSDADWLP